MEYRGVTRHKKGWQAQAHGQYLGYFSQKHQAALKVARHLQVPLKDLARQRGSLPNLRPARTHKFVYFHVGRGNWTVKKGTKTLAVAQTQAQAVRKAAAILKLPESKFRLATSKVAAKASINELVAYFKLVYGAYVEGHQRGGRASSIMPSENQVIGSRYIKFLKVLDFTFFWY